jgi:SAM-dependent methyltransferase
MLKDIKAFLAAAKRLPAERIALFRRVREVSEAVVAIAAAQKEMMAKVEKTRTDVKTLAKSTAASAEALAGQNASAESRMQVAVGSMAQEVNAIAQQSALSESRMQSAIGAIAQDVNATVQQTALAGSQLQNAIGLMAQDVNATLNMAHQQQENEKRLLADVEELKVQLSAQNRRIAAVTGASGNAVAGLQKTSEDQLGKLVQETRKSLDRVAKGASTQIEGVVALLNDQEARQNEQLGRIANEVNASLNAVTGQQSANNAVAQLVTSALATMSSQQAVLGAMANDVNAALSAVSGQQAVIGPMANEVNAALSAVNSQQAVLGPMANEMNAVLNSLLAQQSAQSSMLTTLSRIETDAALERERTLGLNLLVGRGTAALVRRQGEPQAARKPVSAPTKPVPIAGQIEALGKLAPKNIKAWTAAFKAGIAEGERSSEGNLSHDGHLGAGYFRFFVNVHGRGRLLDFGCGPLPVPAYLADWPLDQLAGFDPQKPFAPHPFPFAQSLGEAIPWDDASFETVVVATSLDHVYLLDKALAEIKRVLVPGGRLLLWTALLDESPAYDPYSARISPPDEYHLFHPARNWFPELFARDYDLVERMETVAQAEMLAYQLKP